MDLGWIVIAVLVGMFLLVTWALCRVATKREMMEELWRHPPDSEVKDDEDD